MRRADVGDDGGFVLYERGFAFEGLPLRGGLILLNWRR
jgi:hypothetical protein